MEQPKQNGKEQNGGIRKIRYQASRPRRRKKASINYQYSWTENLTASSAVGFSNFNGIMRLRNKYPKAAKLARERKQIYN